MACVACIAAGNDALQQLGLTIDDAHERVVSMAAHGNGMVPMAARKISGQARLEVAKYVLAFAKDYTKTPDFKARYDKWWRESEPAKPQTLDERRKERDDEEARSKQNADETEANLRKQIAETNDATVKKALQDGLKSYMDMKKQMDSNPDVKKAQEQGKAMQAEEDKSNYEKEMKQYNDDYRAWQAKKDANMALRQVLKHYLEVEKTVDYNAQTVQSGGGVRDFVSETYKTKPAEWKTIYRAGKDVNDYARNFAAQWLADIK